MVSWRSQQVPLRLHAQFPPVFPVQGIHELWHEPSWMILGNQLV